MASDIQADEMLQALGKEVMKVYQIFDGSDRVVTRYEALSNAIDQGQCVKTVYTYTGARTAPDKMMESLDVWLDAYNIP